mmetsp:Transcript_27028/g.86901  ORF Transcript_27028/g.86901 Transcript_27028/m.86901 type:complete len:395 (+) Transcript_27028:1257-2441(+)
MALMASLSWCIPSPGATRCAMGDASFLRGHFESLTQGSSASSAQRAATRSSRRRCRYLRPKRGQQRVARREMANAAARIVHPRSCRCCAIAAAGQPFCLHPLSAVLVPLARLALAVLLCTPQMGSGAPLQLRIRRSSLLLLCCCPTGMVAKATPAVRSIHAPATVLDLLAVPVLLAFQKRLGLWSAWRMTSAAHAGRMHCSGPATSRLPRVPFWACMPPMLRRRILPPRSTLTATKCRGRRARISVARAHAQVQRSVAHRCMHAPGAPCTLTSCRSVWRSRFCQTSSSLPPLPSFGRTPSRGGCCRHWVSLPTCGSTEAVTTPLPTLHLRHRPACAPSAAAWTRQACRCCTLRLHCSTWSSLRSCGWLMWPFGGSLRASQPHTPVSTCLPLWQS